MLLLDLDQVNKNNFYFRAKLVRPEMERGQVSEASHHGHLFNFPLSPYRVLLKIKWFSFSWLQAWWFWLSLFCLHTVTCDLTNKEESIYHLGVTSQIQMSPQKHILLGNDKWMSNFVFQKLYPNIYQYIWCILAGSFACHKKMRTVQRRRNVDYCFQVLINMPHVVFTMQCRTASGWHTEVKIGLPQKVFWLVLWLMVAWMVFEEERRVWGSRVFQQIENIYILSYRLLILDSDGR